jgi:hypothetical protein
MGSPGWVGRFGWWVWSHYITAPKELFLLCILEPSLLPVLWALPAYVSVSFVCHILGGCSWCFVPPVFNSVLFCIHATSVLCYTHDHLIPCLCSTAILTGRLWRLLLPAAVILVTFYRCLVSCLLSLGALVLDVALLPVCSVCRLLPPSALLLPSCSVSFLPYLHVLLPVCASCSVCFLLYLRMGVPSVLCLPACLPASAGACQEPSLPAFCPSSCLLSAVTPGCLGLLLLGFMLGGPVCVAIFTL